MVLPDMCEAGDRDDDHDIPAGPNVPSIYQLNVHIRDYNLASPENDGIIQEGLHRQESQEQEERIQPLSQPPTEHQNDQEPVPHSDQATANAGNNLSTPPDQINSPVTASGNNEQFVVTFTSRKYGFQRTGRRWSDSPAVGPNRDQV
uniref:Uncharacterized protein n=1 Tax=Biomphalaria glabrata TaxID=6526 RepID=A0A2C9LBP0_BIOGL